MCRTGEIVKINLQFGLTKCDKEIMIYKLSLI